MKAEILEGLATFERRLRRLRREVRQLETPRVNRKAPRAEAAAIADLWVESLRSPLEHQFGLPRDTIKEMSEHMKRLHVLSRPNNRRTSYDETLTAALSKFQDRFVLPIQQLNLDPETTFDLQRLVAGLDDADMSDYLKEAVDCANAGFHRAAVVMGWCAVIDRLQRTVQHLGVDRFNETSSELKSKGGRFKWFKKEFSVTTVSDLQRVFDSDLITVAEGMGLLDGNQADRLKANFAYRNHSAHPGEAPIDETHVVAFFSDIVSIVLANPAFRPDSAETPD